MENLEKLYPKNKIIDLITLYIFKTSTDSVTGSYTIDFDDIKEYCKECLSFEIELTEQEKNNISKKLFENFNQVISYVDITEDAFDVGIFTSFLEGYIDSEEEENNEVTFEDVSQKIIVLAEEEIKNINSEFITLRIPIEKIENCFATVEIDKNDLHEINTYKSRLKEYYKENLYTFTILDNDFLIQIYKKI